MLLLIVGLVFIFGIRIAIGFGQLLLKLANRIGRDTGYYSDPMIISLVISILLLILCVIPVVYQSDFATKHPYDLINVYMVIAAIAAGLISLAIFWVYALFEDFWRQLAIKIGGLLIFITLIILYFTGHPNLSTALFTLFFAALQYYHYRIS